MAQRMSSPDGSEVLTVTDGVGASVLASLGWKTESGGASQKRSSPRSAEDTAQQSSESSTSDESGRKRSPGRPRKHPGQEGE